MRCASCGPMPGKTSNSATLAVLILTLPVCGGAAVARGAPVVGMPAGGGTGVGAAAARRCDATRQRGTSRRCVLRIAKTKTPAAIATATSMAIRFFDPTSPLMNPRLALLLEFRCRAGFLQFVKQGRKANSSVLE